MFNFETLKTTSNKKGSALILTLVFGSIFLMSFGAILSLILVEHKAMDRKIASTKSLEVAEAGLNQFRWRLAHDDDDYTTLDQDYTDPYGATIGHFTVTATEPETGSTIVELESTGYVNEFPGTTRTIRAKYGKPSLAEYAIVTDSNIWIGEDEEVFGEVHSNGGIRMDGECDSRMTSPKETYICGTEHGCADEEKPGIWGDGVIEELWDFPVTDAVDFDAITVDFDDLMAEAIANGVYLGDSGAHGYQVNFDGENIDINTVTGLENPVWGYNGTDWVNESNSVKKTKALAGYQNIPIPDNGLIFIEDEVWVEGDLDGKVTIVAARLPAGVEPNASIRIQNDINYKGPKDETYSLGLIAQEDVLIPLYSDATLRIDAALIAQNGHVFRYYYPYQEAWCWSWCSKHPYSAYSVRSVIQTFGMIMSKDVWTFSWVDGSGNVISGYDRTDTIYDPYLKEFPPLYFPTTGEYEFISWEEILPTEE